MNYYIVLTITSPDWLIDLTELDSVGIKSDHWNYGS